MPAHTQYASSHLISAIAYHGLDPAADPAWASTGATTVEEYARWSRNLCGMACLRMLLAHRDGTAPSLFDLAAMARRHRAYVEESDGSIKGLIYAPFVAYVHEAHEINATVHRDLSMVELSQLLQAGRMVMASVHKEIRRPDRDPPGRGGHLVLVIGQDECGRLHWRNPSGHTHQARIAAHPPEVFARFFGHRGISLDPAPATRRPAASSTDAKTPGDRR
ncbi:C39 family peptidase [Streptantibioticus ferralitis]|uniref:C39 family peptidase n=1 Tax=Streptantibioticus ferralitis TaxID=236510 RepID=A0ABT5Z1E6_9ACTN|nr:C39 family peptidase [Streptantibioticus ferralitis]MDF2257661.1 C39 family peptidase [Streptantibioticus ferralitis]